jgi:class 3 adenylate cyclase/tetratricopeptide (TPR) repeat protein
MPEKVSQQTEELKNAIATLESQRAVLGDAVVDASLSALRKQLAELDPDVETGDRHKKLVSMLFVDVVGSTTLGQDLEPDEILEIMDGGLQRLAIPVEAHDGRVTRFMGDGFKAVFGEPAAQENDAEMAVRAGLEILADAKAYAADLEEKWHVSGFDVRVGVNTGMVAVGGFTESDDTVMGLTVNLGARLESAAPPGGLLISQTTYRHVRGIFEFEPMPPITAKGFEEPIQVYLVIGSKPKAFRTKTRGVEGVTTRMIGRDGEFKRLQDAYFTAVEDNQCQVITVIGEAGIGKSRLLEEFETWLDHQGEGRYQLKGRRGPEFKDSPYSLLRDMFSERFQIRASDTASEVQGKFESGISETRSQDEHYHMWAHFIGQLLGFDFSDSPDLTGVLDDAMQLRDRTWIYLAEYFKTTANNAPVIIFLDDIHWADDNSLDVITYLAQSLSDQPLLIICLGRSLLLERRPLWGEGHGYHTRINLEALSTRDCRRLVEDILQKMGQVPLALRELVVSGAEGNPFYIEELIKMLIDSGVIDTRSEQWQVEPSSLAGLLADLNVPSTLTALLQARLDQLAPGEKNLLQQASVVGRVFWDDVIRYLSSSSNQQSASQQDISELLGALRRKEMIYHRETSALDLAEEYSFKNVILREVTYDTILKKIRRSYHAQVAEWLLQVNMARAGELTGLLAEHLELAGETQRAAAYYRQAGEQAARQYANQSALKLLGHALELTPVSDLEERYACLCARVQVYSLLGSRAEQEQDLAQLVELAPQLDDQHKRAEVAMLQATAASERSNYSEVILHAQEVIDLSQSVQFPEIEIKANILWGRALLSQGDYPGAEQRFSLASQLANASQLPILKADSSRYQGVVAERLGDLPTAIRHFETSLEQYRQIGDRRGEGRTLNHLGNILLMQGDRTGGKQYYDQFLIISREIGDRWGEGQVIRNIGDTYLSRYDYAGASKYFEQALEITREIGNRTIESSALVGLGNVYIEQGEFTKAKNVFEQSLNIAREIGNQPWEAKTLNQIGRYFHLQGDYLRAQSYYESAVGIYAQLGNQLSRGRVLIDLCLLQHHLGDDDTALEISSAALEIIEQSNRPKYIGQALTQAGRVYIGLGDFEAAEKHLLKAEEYFSQADQVNLLMEPRAGLANLRLMGNDDSSALTHAEYILNHLEAVQSASAADQRDQAGAIPGLEGTHDPLWIYLVCCQVLSKTNDLRAADLIKTAYDLLQQQASRITDPDLHFSFINNVKANQAINSLYSRGAAG